jgi:hypothetical protein
MNGIEGAVRFLGITGHFEPLERNVKWAPEVSRLSEDQIRELACRMLPVGRQARYFDHWNLGA